MTNIEKLSDFIMERNPDLFPIYLKVLETVFNSLDDHRPEGGLLPAPNAGKKEAAV